MRKVRETAFLAFLAILAGLESAPALASETVNYSYDTQGRLVQASHSGSGPNSALAIIIQYDSKGNRVSQTVTGSTNAGQEVVVLPLNGFTVIPINP